MTKSDDEDDAIPWIANMPMLGRPPLMRDKPITITEEMHDSMQEAARTSLLVDRTILVEALEQIEATWEHEFGRCSGGTCHRYQNPGEPKSHTPGCRYVRVRDALKRSLGK